MAATRRRRRRRSNPHRRRHRRNPLLYLSTGRRRRSRGRRGYRRNPILPTNLFTQALTVGAGFLAAPMLGRLIPIETTTKVGEYVKQGAAVAIGSAVATRTLGRKFGNALLAGGLIYIAVDALRSYVPAFGGTGVGYYFPPEAELGAFAAAGGDICLPGEMGAGGGLPERYKSHLAN